VSHPARATAATVWDTEAFPERIARKESVVRSLETRDFRVSVDKGNLHTDAAHLTVGKGDAEDADNALPRRPQ
jgi:hypothetical protein